MIEIKKTSMKVRLDDSRENIIVTVDIRDTDCLDRTAEFVFQRKAHVNDTSAVHATDTVYRCSIRTKSHLEFTIPTDQLRGFTYDGYLLDIQYRAILTINDGLFFDTKLSKKLVHQVLDKPKRLGNAQSLIDPKDEFDFMTNLRAVPMHNQVGTLLLLAAGVLVILVNTLIGVHDEMVPGYQTIMYSQRDSDGDPSSPLGQSLVGSGAAGAAIWFAIRRQLRKYMRLHLRYGSGEIHRGSKVNIQELIHGKSRCDLDDVRLRIVACNLEKGQYVRGSGSNRRVVSFSKPINGVLLYQQHAQHIPANKPVETYFRGGVDFSRMFDQLYPEQMVTKTHGLSVYWELQLLSPTLVDQEVVGSVAKLRMKDFYHDGT